MEKNKQQVPRLRFPGFNDAWEQRKLGECVKFKVTNSFSRENLNYENGQARNIHYGDIHTKFQALFDIAKEKVPFINSEMNLDKISEDFYCKEGDLVFADASEDLKDVGKSIEIINLNNEKVLSGLHTLLARPSEKKFSKGFNGCLFQSSNIRLQIQKQAQGSKVLSINAGRLSTIVLSFPALKEQTLIGNFFRQLDAAIASHQRKLERVKELKKSLLQKMFPKDGEAFPELRFPNFTDAWEQRKLGEVAERVTRKNTEMISKLPLTISAQYGLIAQTEFFDKQIASKNISGYYLIKNGEFAYNKSYSNGYPWGAVKRLNNYDYGVLSTLYIVFKPTNINSQFLVSYYDTNYWHNQVASIAVEGARNHGLLNISASEFFTTTLAIPKSIQEQTAIGDFFRQLDAAIASHQRKLEHMQTLKKGLLQQMFV